MDWWKTVHVNRLTLSLDHNALWISFCYSHWYAMAQSICRTLVIILKNLRLDSLEVYMTYVFKTLLKFTRQLANRHCFTCNLKLFKFFFGLVLIFLLMLHWVHWGVNTFPLFLIYYRINRISRFELFFVHLYKNHIQIANIDCSLPDHIIFLPKMFFS